MARRIEEAAALEKEQPEKAVAIYQEALSAARDLDQVGQLAGRVQKLGVAVDLPRYLGFVLRWKVIGPLDNTDGKGFDAAYPPEQKIDLEAPCQGKHGEIRWIDHVTDHTHG